MKYVLHGHLFVAAIAASYFQLHVHVYLPGIHTVNLIS